LASREWRESYLQALKRKIRAIFIPEAAMHIQHETPTELVTADGTLWMSAPFVLGFVYMLYQMIHRASTRRGSHWDILAPIIMALFAWASAQHTRFAFNANQRTVKWRRFQYFHIRSGSCSFDEVTDVAIETTLTDKGGKVHRLVLVTPQARIPMSNGYSGLGNFDKMRARILEFVKGPGAAGTAAADKEAELISSLKSLLAQERKIDAVKLLHQSEGGGLAEAKQRIDALEAEMKEGG
jgi:hypothetical protein